MSYMLVLQFDAQTLSDYDTLIAFEDRISEAISSVDEVDGHDMGGNEMNIFIMTESPKAALERVMIAVPELKDQNDFKAAFRLLDGEQYTALWPNNLIGFSVK